MFIVWITSRASLLTTFRGPQLTYEILTLCDQNRATSKVYGWNMQSLLFYDFFLFFFVSFWPFLVAVAALLVDMCNGKMNEASLRQNIICCGRMGLSHFPQQFGPDSNYWFRCLDRIVRKRFFIVLHVSAGNFQTYPSWWTTYQLKKLVELWCCILLDLA